MIPNSTLSKKEFIPQTTKRVAQPLSEAKSQKPKKNDDSKKSEKIKKWDPCAFYYY